MGKLCLSQQKICSLKLNYGETYVEMKFVLYRAEGGPRWNATMPPDHVLTSPNTVWFANDVRLSVTFH
jgi:hypothetical protein